MAIVFAEISGNHGGDLVKAKELIRAAAKTGCEAVKFQLYKPDDMPDAGIGDNRSMYEKLHVPQDWLGALFEVAHAVGIELFASVFAPWAVEALKPFSPFAYKIASPESTRLTDYMPLLRAIWSTDAELIMSAGHNDIEWASDMQPDVLMFCKPGYPATLSHYDFELVKWHQPMGFSDHTAGIVGALAMKAMGAEHIEKHFKIDDDCVDAAFSLNPNEMRKLCDLCS